MKGKDLDVVLLQNTVTQISLVTAIAVMQRRRTLIHVVVKEQKKKVHSATNYVAYDFAFYLF